VSKFALVLPPVNFTKEGQEASEILTENIGWAYNYGHKSRVRAE